MEQIMEYLPVIIPLAIIQTGLMVAALVHVLTHKKFRVGNQLIWVLVVLLVSVIGPVLYFCVGRGEDGGGEEGGM